MLTEMRSNEKYRELEAVQMEVEVLCFFLWAKNDR